MTVNAIKLTAGLIFAVLLLGGCSAKDTASDLPQLKGELQPINTNEKYKIMIEKQHSSVADTESAGNADK
jgi:hypothetical protein